MTEHDNHPSPVDAPPETAGLNVPPRQPTQESTGWSVSGWGVLGQQSLFILFTLALFGVFAMIKQPLVLIPFILAVIANLVMLGGYFTIEPNEARVLILFGAYRGTVKTSGFRWTNPFNRALPISLRARNFETQKLKVNDKRGNPVEIAAVVVWRVVDTARAMFDVDAYEGFVAVQSESAIRHVATSYAYDHGGAAGEAEITLRGNVDDVCAALQKELRNRLAQAGVEIVEARLTHLAYAPEIAQAMLRRQQAEAVIAARRTIVEGAVSIVDMALRDLAAKQVVQLDDERKAAMVANLLVVLCGESQAQPVINAGTLYH
ncbi:MAG: SPFH domain-containing protein [Lentisphaeria bacterium]